MISYDARTVLAIFDAEPALDKNQATAILDRLESDMPLADSLVITNLVAGFEQEGPIDTLQTVVELGRSSRHMARLLVADIGVGEGYRLWQHTQAGLYRFDEDPPGKAFDTDERRVARTALLMIATGTPLAQAATGSKQNRAEYSVKVARNLLGPVSDEVLDEDDKLTVELLISHDLIGQAVRGNIPQEDAAAQLAVLKQQFPDKYRDKFDALVRTVYLANATSYTWFAKYQDTAGDLHRSWPGLNLLFRRRPPGVNLRWAGQRQILDDLTPAAVEQDQEIWEQIGSPKELVGWHMVGGAMGGVVRRAMEGKQRRPLRVQAVDALMDRTPPLSLEHVADPQIAALHERASFWHGSGRFRYHNGAVVDVLQAVTEGKALKAHLDAFDVVTGPMEIISLSRARMYARAYADMFRFQPSEQDVRHGDSQFWGSVYLTDTIMQSLVENRVWKLSGYRTLVHHVGQDKLRDWCAKFTQAPVRSTAQLYQDGSDITGNYPILFGIKPGTFTPVETSRSVALHEVRTQEALTLPDDITHLEVPEANLDETHAILQATGLERLPVKSIEAAERHLARTAFSALVLGRAA